MGCITGDIWTHGEYVQYAIVDPTSITIWRVSFTSIHPPMQVTTLPTPSNFPEQIPSNLEFLPIFSLLAFIHQGKILVWDAQYQKILLDSTSNNAIDSISFSPDGQLLIHKFGISGFYLWKRSPNGYLPYQKLLPNPKCNFLLTSPDLGSIITSSGPALQLWHSNSLPSLQSIPPAEQTQGVYPGFFPQAQQTWGVYLEFLPGGSSVAIAESGKAVTILDLKSGKSQVIIDVGMGICGMGIVGSNIIVVSSGRSIIWELPGRNHIFGAKWDVEDSIQTITFEGELKGHQISISPNLDYMVGIDYRGHLAIFNLYTGKRLDTVNSNRYLPGITLDGDKVWCIAEDGEVVQWEIVKDEISGTIKLDYPKSTETLDSFPWHASCNYEVTDDGWVVSSRGQHLLWLPHKWQSDEKNKEKWSGKILALLYTGLPEAIILELEV